MLLYLLTFQQKWATKKVLTFFAASYLLFPLYLLPKILPQGRPLDLHLYYSPELANQLIESYGEFNRAAYIFGSATIDMLYPLFYATFLGLLLSFFIVKTFKQQSKMQYIRLFPYIMLLVDVGENIAIITMLAIYPSRNDFLAHIASLLTTTKWLLFVVVIMMLVYLLVRYYRQASCNGFRPKKTPE